jgi:RNA polymerase sigma-70 factor (sigma-E family)
VPRLQEDDAAAFDAFVVARRGSLMRTALLLTGDRGRAEDPVQTALFETFRRWPRLRDQADPVGYARKTLVATHLNWIRRRSWHEPAVGQIVDISQLTAADDDVGRVAERLRMRAAVLALPPRMRAVLVLHFFEDLSERDTAELLGCSAGTVKSQTARGLSRLREQLGDDKTARPVEEAR